MVTGIIQAVNGKTQIRQYIVIDNVVQEDGIGIKCILGQDDAIVKWLLFANGCAPVDFTVTLKRSVIKGCEALHKTHVCSVTLYFSVRYERLRVRFARHTVCCGRHVNGVRNYVKTLPDPASPSISCASEPPPYSIFVRREVLAKESL